jgi:uncharacterized membrane protein required for colicin V production
MHWLDITLLIILGLGLALGAWSGLLWQVSRMVTAVAAIYAGVFGHPFIAYLLKTYAKVDWDDWIVTTVSFLIALFSVVIVMLIITTLIDRWLRTKKKLKMLDRLLGAGLGLCTMSLLAGAMLFIMVIVATDWSKEQVSRSYVAAPLLVVLRGVITLMPEDTKKSWTASLDQVKEAANNAKQDALNKVLSDPAKSPADKKSKP